jgi:glycosyltransferase involved in cell wall biosynthesis
MRIALVTPQWSGTTGGPSNYTSALQVELRKLGHTVSVITTDLGDGAILVRGGILTRDWRLFREFRKFRPDIIHIQGRAHFIPAALAYRRLARKPRIIFTFHTQPFIGAFVPSLGEGRPDYTKATQVIASFLLRRCDVVTAVSESIIRNLNSHYALGISDFKILSSGGYPSVADPDGVRQFRDRHQLDGHSPLLASIGVLSWDWKVAGHQLCIDAVPSLIPHYPRLLLLIAGDGRHRAHLEAYVRQRGVENHVRFLGNVPNSAPVLAIADLYLQMAMHEGCSLALIEAMFAGKPIIAAGLGGTPEVVEDGLSARVIPADPDRIASSVRELLDDAVTRKSIALGARDRAMRSFTWSHVAQQYERLYASALASP